MTAIPLEVLVLQVSSRFDIVRPKRYLSFSFSGKLEYRQASRRAYVGCTNLFLVPQDSQSLEILPKMESGEGGVARQVIFLLA